MFRNTKQPTLEIDAGLDELHVSSEERLDWLTLENNDPGYHEYTDQELVMHVREESEEKNEEGDAIVTQTVSHVQACQALETVLAYLEQQLEIPMTLKQTRVSDYFEKSSTCTD